MNKKIIIITVSVIAVAGTAFLLSSQPSEQNGATQAESSNGQANREQEVEKVKVYYFHNSARCASCRTLEKYTRQTIEEFFQPELRDEKIEYKAVNVDLPKNKELAQKYEASGSSLFINRVIDGQDNIEQDTTAWRLLSDENRFKSYLADKINSYLD